MLSDRFSHATPFLSEVNLQDCLYSFSKAKSSEISLSDRMLEMF